MLLSPVFAGVYEDALKSNDKVFLYMYTPHCGYCTRFNPVYNKLATNYRQKFEFLKINADTQYGSSIMQNMNAEYVPYVVMVDGKKRVRQQILPKCLLDYTCASYAIDKFIK